MIGRIHGSAAFERTRREGTRVRSSLVWCTMLLDPSLSRPHVGYAIGRPVGNAVTRNRARRRLRAGVAARAAALRPGWYVIGARTDAATCSSGRLAADLDVLVRKLAAVPAPGPS